MRKIQDDLWIGNAHDARDLRAVLDAGIEAIVDLALEEPPVSPRRELIYLRIPILDGDGNSNNILRLAIETICKLVDSNIPTLVACSAGMSRSPAIVSAALAKQKRISFDNALVDVTISGPCDVSPALVNQIQTVLNAT